MSGLRHFLLSDVIAKLLAIGVALCIWIGVNAAQERVGTFPGGIPVELENLPVGLVATEADQRVDITVVAEGALWQTFTQESFRASIDLAGADAGVHDTTVHVTSSAPGARIVGIKPQHVLVRLEPLEQKTVPVRVSYDGQAADGFAAGEAIVTPAAVTLTGPRSELGRFDEAEVRIKLSGERQPLTLSAPVSLRAEESGILSTTIAPKVLSVSVPIERAGTIKTVGVVVRTEGTPPAGFVVSSLSVSPSTVVVTGSAAALSGLSSLKTKPIRLSEVRESSSITTELELPDDIRLVDPSSASASVALSVQPGLPTNP